MNKKGQTLVIFVLLLPIFIALLAFVIDVGLMTYENIKLKNTTKSILNDVVKKNKINEESIITLYKENDINIDNLKIEITENEIVIHNNYFIESMFGKILKINEYEVNVNGKINLENKKIDLE